MFQLHLTRIIICIIVLLHSSIIQCHPHSQNIRVHGHEWTVPNEPGWDDVVQKADSIRRQWLSNCITTSDCRLAAEQLRQVFLKHPISSIYYDDSLENNIHDNDESSIFKWG